MLKFFRKIRHQLLSKNKFSAYLVYAIGEIVLVVIGILIALQINNRNTARQESKAVDGYLHNIAKNIEADQENLATIHAFRDSSMVSSRYFMRMIEQERVSKDNVSEYFSRYMRYNPLFDESFQADLSGFEALKNSGYLGKIQGTSIETELYKYYRIVDKINEEEQSLNNFMEEMEYEMYKNNIVQQLRSIIRRIGQGKESQQDIDDLQVILKYPPFVGANSRNVGVNYLNELYDELLEVGNNILSKVKERMTHE